MQTWPLLGMSWHLFVPLCGTYVQSNFIYWTVLDGGSPRA